MCGDKKCPFQWRNQFWQTLEGGAGKPGSESVYAGLSCQSPSAWSACQPACLCNCVYICISTSPVMATRLSDHVFLLCRPLCPGVLPDSEHGDGEDPQDSVPNLGPDAHLWGDWDPWQAQKPGEVPAWCLHRALWPRHICEFTLGGVVWCACCAFSSLPYPHVHTHMHVCSHSFTLSLSLIALI